jgi:5-bromo-4-chloroindolyl phosphate hydrolysis protein
MNNGKSGCLSTVAVIALIVLLIKIAPMLFTLIKIGLILSIVGVIAIVVLVIYFSTHKTDAKQSGNPQNTKDEQIPKEEEPDPALTAEQNEILKNGRAHLMELRRRMTHVKHVPIRTVSGNICGEAEKILATLRKKPEKISQVRQFLNYYLPTLGSILEKYVRLEENGALTEAMTDSTLEHLIDIKHAMEAQYQALFDDDKLDLSVEMEALKIACLRDGLLTEEDFKPKTENDTKPNLTL